MFFLLESRHPDGRKAFRRSSRTARERPSPLMRGRAATRTVVPITVPLQHLCSTAATQPQGAAYSRRPGTQARLSSPAALCRPGGASLFLTPRRILLRPNPWLFSMEVMPSTTSRGPRLGAPEAFRAFFALRGPSLPPPAAVRRRVYPAEPPDRASYGQTIGSTMCSK